MIYIAQEGGVHRPIGPFWSGDCWASGDHRKNYASEEKAAEDAYVAVRSARRTILVMNVNDIIMRLKPKRSG